MIFEPDDGSDTKSGDVLVALCSDDLVHAFRVLDDGQMDRPACGSPAREIGDAGDEDLVCIDCIRFMASIVGASPGLAMEAVQQAIEERNKR